MKNQHLERTCRDLALILSYPESGYLSALDEMIQSNINRKARKSLQEFRHAIDGMNTHDLQDLYTRTFDLNPMCSPALSVHLFGVESFKRSHLMVGLLDMYREANFPSRGESADHMSTVIQFLPFAGKEERRDILMLILVPGLTKIADFLESKGNPFAHAIMAAIAVLNLETGKEATYA